MTKPPAFQFYADDFLSGTFDLTDEEVGLYIRMLCVQWTRGSLPNDDAELARLSRGSTGVQPALARVRAKFAVCEDGTLRNERLETERVKQIAFREAQAAKGAASAQARLNRAPTGPQPGRSPKSNSPSPSPSTTTTIQRAQARDPVRMENLQANPPTLDQCREANSKLPEKLTDAELQKFHDHYQSQGWLKTNKVPAFDIFSLLRNWNRTIYENHRATCKPGIRNEYIATTAEDIQRIGDTAAKIAAKTVERIGTRNAVAAKQPANGLHPP
jgi:uncharacterized protein YdaU (DUF1376 family)